MKRSSGLLLTHATQLLTLHGGASARRGAELCELGIIEDGAVLCVGGKIVSVGTTKDALRDPWVKKNRKKLTEIDCRGKVVLPGFVDSHTHPAFIQPRLLVAPIYPGVSPVLLPHLDAAPSSGRSQSWWRPCAWQWRPSVSFRPHLDQERGSPRLSGWQHRRSASSASARPGQRAHIS